MKRHSLLTLLVIPMMVGSCSSPIDRNTFDGDVEITVANQFGDKLGEGQYKEALNYNDDWFFHDSTQINYELALASSLAAGSSYSNELDNDGSKIESFLTTVGYNKIQKNYYYANGVKLDDSLGVIIGQKQVKDEKGNDYTLLAVFPRNSGYGSEWVGNCNITSDGMHQGFMLARDEMLRYLKQYIISNEVKGNLKVWTSGYSRGSAISNLFAAYLVDGNEYLGSEVALAPSDIYAYTIATPASISTNVKTSAFLSVTGARENYHDTDIASYTYAGADVAINPRDTKYGYIHNFIGVGDYVTKLPPSAWNFARFGKDEEVVFGGGDFVNYLKVISPETAQMFEDGRTYASKEPTSKFNYDTLQIVENTALKMSSDEVINARIAALSTVIPSAEEYVNGGYKDVFSSIAAIVAVDGEAFIDGILSSSEVELGKAAILTYLGFNGAKLEQEDKNLISNFAMDILTLFGKDVGNKEEYTDQKFLKHLFDLIINDYQTSVAGEVRVTKISSLLGEPYGPLFLSLAQYAKEKNITVTYFDEFFYLLSSYYVDHPTDETVLGIIEALAGEIPESAVTYLPIITGKTYDDEHYPTLLSKAIAAVKDILTFSALGDADRGINASYFRYFVIMIAGGMVLEEEQACLYDLLMNGTSDGNGNYNYRDAHLLRETMDVILSLVLPTDEESGNRISIKEYGDESLVALLNKGRTEKNSKYVDKLIDNLEPTKKILMAFVFNQGETYNLESDINNALTLYHDFNFIKPAHFFGLYTCYLRTKISA